MVDYRKLRLSNIHTGEFRHVILLLYWVVYLSWWLVSNLLLQGEHHLIHAPLDDRIPFVEAMVIPYCIWYIALFGMTAYLFFFDVTGFRRHMYFVMITFTIASVTFGVYPTCVDLRPDTFERNNVFTWIIGLIYAFDNPVNACPSIHVIGSFGVTFAVWHSRRFASMGWKIGSLLLALLISASTVMIKQHSVVDVYWGILVSVLGYVVVYLIPDLRHRKQTVGSHP